MNHFNSLQSASRGHSQHSVQTDSTHTHTYTHTDDSCPLQREGEQVSAQEAAVEREDGMGGGKSRQNVEKKKEKGKEKERRNDRRIERKPETALMMTCLILFVPVYFYQLSFAQIAVFD